jgi:hypothetical protein
VFCDSDWAVNYETRTIVTGFILYLINVHVCWRSKGQKRVTLLISKVEYGATSESLKEVKFIYYLLFVISAEVNLPIIVIVRCLWHKIALLA